MPPAVVTVTFTTPAASTAGEVTVIEVCEFTVTLPAGTVTVPKATVELARKPVPVTCTVVPPTVEPVAGLSAVTVGVGAV